MVAALLCLPGLSPVPGLSQESSASASDESAPPGSAWLRWRNGDELRGRVLESGTDSIRWESGPFDEPLSLALDQMEAILFAVPTGTTGRDPSPDFRIHFRNGDRLEGALLAIEEELVTVRCPPFLETVQIRRGAIERIVHLKSEHFRYSGPDDLQGWISIGRDRKPTEWFTDLRGAFATHQWSGNLYREIEYPNALEVSFSAEFLAGPPNLEIGLLRDASVGPMIETWDRMLVLTFDNRFVPVMELTQDTTRLDFRLFWNQDNGDLKLCDLSGRVLASLDQVLVDRADSSARRSRSNDPLARGFSITNRSPSLKLHSLTIREWDGLPVPQTESNRPRILVAGERPLFEVDQISLAPGSDHFVVGGRPIPLKKLDEMILSPGPVEAADSGMGSTTRIAWFGGSHVSGVFQGIDRHHLILHPEWAAEPVPVSLRTAKEIRFPEPERPFLQAPDYIEGDGFALHGTARTLPGRTGGGLIGWIPPGAVDPVPFADDFSGTLTRARHSAAGPELSSVIGQARLFLANEEVLVGTLLSISDGTIHFSSRVTGSIAVPADQVRAVDMGSTGRILEGFGDSEWEEIKSSEEDIVFENDSVLLRAGSFGNPSLLLGDRIRFTARWEQSYGAFTLQLYTNSPDTTAASTDLIIAAQGNRLFIGKLKEGGAFSFSGDQIPIHGNSAQFEIATTPEAIEVIVNGKSALTLTIEDDQVSGNGLYFKMGGGWQGWNQKDNEITISEFSMDRSPGSVTHRIIDRRAKENALAVPRSRRDPVPRNLLIAPNGDLLRGQLESASGGNLVFTSNSETFDLPRSRVSAIIWLTPPADAEPTSKSQPAEGEAEPAAAPSAEVDTANAPADTTGAAESDFSPNHYFTLLDGSRLHLAAEKVEDHRFVGRSSILGTCNIVMDNVRTLQFGPVSGDDDAHPANQDRFPAWELSYTPDPVLPTGKDAPTSALVGKPAPPIELSMLDDSKFNLKDHKGKVVVIDFWASWCGPCIKAMPEVRLAVDAFPPGLVSFCTINQAETLPIIRGFLEKRKWTDLPVALDFEMKTSRAYEVEGIPHTVVIGRDGKIAWTHSGFSSDLKEELFQAIVAALE
jgi:thiol-disulfide isomerase/thioredoxin